MKRIIVILLACLLAFPALADVDLASMSYDELEQLKTDVNREMAKRPEQSGFVFPAGVYYSGCGLPDGVYTLTNSRGGGAAFVYKSYESFLNGEDALNRAWVTEGNQYTMNIKGDVCYVIEFPSYIAPFEWVGE